MKNSAEYAKKLNKLCTSLKKGKDATELVDSSIIDDATSVLVFACISEYAQMAKAQVAWRKLRSSFVDFNELRVSRQREIVIALGKNYPGVDIVSPRLVKLLHAVFEKYNGLDMAGLQDMGKREAQTVIKDLDGITPYIYSFFVMYFLDAHAFPLNETMFDVLRKEDVFNSASDFDDAHGFLERQIPAAKSKEVFAMLRNYCDHYNLQTGNNQPEDDEQAELAKKTVAKKAVAKKTVAKKVVAKKTATKTELTKAVESDTKAETKSVTKPAAKKTVAKTAKKTVK